MLLPLFSVSSFFVARIRKLGELTDDLDLLSYIWTAVEAVEIVLELGQIVRPCIIGILDLAVIYSPGLVCLGKALYQSPVV